MDTPSIHTIDYITIVVYLLLMMGVGWAFKNFNKGISDYFKGGSRGTWWLVGMSMFMGTFSAWTFTGAAGVAYQAGWSASIIFLSTATGYLLNFICTGPWFRQIRVTTGPEVLRMRYGNGTQQYYAWISIVTGLLYAGLHLYGLSIFCSAVFGLPVEGVIIVIGIAVLFYATTGGSWAVMATDFLQSLILLPITILVAWLAYRAIGGFGELQAAVVAQGLSEDFKIVNSPGEFAAGAFTWGWVAAMFTKNVIAWNTLGSATRFFALKDGRDARKASLLCVVLMLMGAGIWFLPPMVARLLYSDQIEAIELGKSAEAAYAIVSMNLLPPGLMGLVVVAMFTATMSSMDTGLNRNAAIIVKDVYPAFCRLLSKTPRSDEELLKASRIVSLLLGIGIILLSLYYSKRAGAGVFEIMLSIGAYLSLPLSVPTLLGLFFKRVPGWAAVFSSLSAFCASVYLGISPQWGAPKVDFQVTVLIVLTVGTIAFFVSGFWWPKVSDAYRERVNAFFKNMYTPVDFEKEVGDANDSHQLRLIGKIAVIVAALVLLLIPFPETWADKVEVLFVSGFLFLVGGLMWLSGVRADRAKSKSL
ncbi:sodium:solute symporter family transporter [Cerasicoccus maritimus]|uniref:sodium:solute symporter family transporter n=1 Tax=Cerasicoccus maritimus TaxID=490089 RepID=UPI002852B799|nr:hypothetical protein [Cerasicoccus maritimus]